MRAQAHRRRLLGAIAATAVLVAAAPASHVAAQSYPARPITLVVPFPAGGPLDTGARVMAERMRVTLGQPVIIENVTGASGSIGVGRVARAAPDGYTLVVGGTPTHVMNGAVMALPYDVVHDFAPLALTTNAPSLIAAKKAMPASDLKELIAWLKANPSKAAQGTGGVGTTSHIAGLFFQQVTGTRFTLVPYRGAGPAVQDLVAGQIDLMIDPASNTMSYVRAGTLKAYAVTAKRRMTQIPHVPTVDEAGLPGFHVLNWTAYFAPKGTPKPIVDKLNAAIADALTDPAVVKRAADLGQEIFPREMQTPAALAAFHKSEIAKWWPVIKAANIKVQ
jgi:tripartite-type tricarboxylate transporter receptor subunit TctC